jgi:hypothetical protein
MYRRDKSGIAVSVVLTLLVWTFYGDAARLWWTFADFFHIHLLKYATRFARDRAGALGTRPVEHEGWDDSI